ncbi:MAG: 4-(cytidine 5'-diphospho)-2-C-methyl-D-erythritol kinase [Oscillospiraceae bacterium]
MLNEKITVMAHAKLNLYLDIVGTRADGYHLLETVLQSVDLCDIVEVSAAREGIEVSCSNPEIPTGEKNICHKAAKRFIERVGGKFGAEIRIEKRIPDGAGLGGGSADAAAVLYALNELNGLPMRSDEILQLAAEIGADVPFCLTGGLAVCKGIGEVIEPLKPLPELFYLIVKPNFRCPTQIAYQLWDSAPVPAKNTLKAFCNAGSRYPELLYNVFEEIYGNVEISSIKAKLRDTSALGSCLTGSGSAVFGVYETAEQAASAARAFPEMFTVVAKPVGSGLAII